MRTRDVVIVVVVTVSLVLVLVVVVTRGFVVVDVDEE